MATTAERIFELVQTMPEREAAEVLDFAEFLRQKAEDAEDLADAQAALGRLERGEETTVSWAAIKAEHGL